MKRLSVLGSTGSIGTQTLEIVRRNPELKVTALAAGSDIASLEAQIREFRPAVVCVYNREKADELRIKIKDTDTAVFSGMDGLIETACHKDADIVLTAMVGMIGIQPTIEAIKAGKDIALANKETLVTAGHLIMPLAKQCGVRILPVDSEHSAIFQSLNGEDSENISRIILTASGGPFRGLTREQMQGIRPEDALKHPNWSMGRKITIDSATLVNKGLEVMEAKWLFDVPLEKVEVIVHPQSIIHSMVEFVDGAIIAQLGCPDMKLPIQYALFYPERRYLDGDRLDFAAIKNFTFEAPDLKNFPGLKLAYDASAAGGTMPTVYNAANEYAVRKFLDNEIRFLDIAEIISLAMDGHKVIGNPSVEEILQTETDTYYRIESR
ncbi:1-deoxy-D-xylulose-5-phosphate reductoisomerase [Parasporobacterium paucivorans]|uniref:1-deoxy-D-xylulose 5-phosphate reductoisomerase n=1 Tax=Parasporobacterium paucivorans DSM 15970 TaxID=1122934 RepID=A0A1M6AG97_9FIRM|nr:1-deoxy-D-xylulose-5-phosphate reductoisomerase [Parasporobacterium paucivorans]SHI35447.1 1-deoxy-D-xylulose 5-phosphate reductoisomerase [Parasporobacterium paucivorans DSM 15970]